MVAHKQGSLARAQEALDSANFVYPAVSTHVVAELTVLANVTYVLSSSQNLFSLFGACSLRSRTAPKAPARIAFPPGTCRLSDPRQSCRLKRIRSATANFPLEPSSPERPDAVTNELC